MYFFLVLKGLPVKLYCDKTTNFVGSNSKLQELKRQFFVEYNQTELLNFVAERSTEFVFVPLRDPHFGGL